MAHSRKSQSNKVFIYNGTGASKESSQDLATLFRENHTTLFEQQPDIIECDFKFSPNGLHTPTLVMPGGSVSSICYKVKPSITSIETSTVGKNYNYVGVCAGAYAATSNASLYSARHAPHISNPIVAETTDFMWTFNHELTFNIVKNFDSIGSFFPYYELKQTDKDYVPYAVSIRTTAQKQLLKSLFVGGCGFISHNDYQNGNGEVVAHYDDKNTYRFKGENSQIQKHVKLSSVVRIAPTDITGGIVLTGVHLEASVRNSSIFNALTRATDSCEKLSETEQLDILRGREELQSYSIDLLKRTLK